MRDCNFINIETLNKYQRFLYGHEDQFKKLSNLFDKQIRKFKKLIFMTV